jgi:hypothetical protein
VLVFRNGGFLRFSVDDREGSTTISATIHRSTVSTPIRARRRGTTRSTTRRPAAATPRPRPSARRAPLRRAHLLEQEVTLAYLRELAQH